MKMTHLVTAGLAIAAIGTGASAQAWNAPPPQGPYGYPVAPPPPPEGHVVSRSYWNGYGYVSARRHHHHRHCWTDYRQGGYEKVKVCR